MQEEEGEMMESQGCLSGGYPEFLRTAEDGRSVLSALQLLIYASHVTTKGVRGVMCVGVGWGDSKYRSCFYL